MAGTPVERRLTREVRESGGIEGLLAKIASGVTITKLGKDFGVSRNFMSTWLSKTAGRERIDAAKREAAAALVDECLEIADDAVQDRDDRTAKLRIETRRWLAGRLDPETFAEQRAPLVEFNLGELHLDALRAVEARVKAAGGGGAIQSSGEGVSVIEGEAMRLRDAEPQEGAV